jgi:hypothetical protein
MLTQRSDGLIEGKHLFFREERSDGRLTRIWSVWNKYDDIPLGSIEWFTKFRKYSFFPLPERVFEEDCLRDIADFVVEKTRERKEERTTK